MNPRGDGLVIVKCQRKESKREEVHYWYTFLVIIPVSFLKIKREREGGEKERGREEEVQMGGRLLGRVL